MNDSQLMPQALRLLRSEQHALDDARRGAGTNNTVARAVLALGSSIPRGATEPTANSRTMTRHPVNVPRDTSARDVSLPALRSLPMAALDAVSGRWRLRRD